MLDPSRTRGEIAFELVDGGASRQRISVADSSGGGRGRGWITQSPAVSKLTPSRE